MLFFVAERLCMSVVAVERMSRREVTGWLTWFQSAQHTTDDALDPKTMTKAELRSMFR